jgi:hypothetical protein
MGINETAVAPFLWEQGGPPTYRVRPAITDDARSVRGPDSVDEDSHYTYSPVQRAVTCLRNGPVTKITVTPEAVAR